MVSTNSAADFRATGGGNRIAQARSDVTAENFQPDSVWPKCELASPRSLRTSEQRGQPERVRQALCMRTASCKPSPPH